MLSKETIRQRNRDAFLAESDYIPLKIMVPNPDLPKINRWEITMEPDKALEFGLAETRYCRELSTDWFPYLTTYYQDILIPGLFGAELFDGFKDKNPMPKPCFEDIQEVDRFQLEDMDTRSPLMEQALDFHRTLLSQVPEDLEVTAPAVTSPLDYAVNMRGGDFFVDMVIEPERAKRFLALITELIIQKIRLFKDVSNEPDDEYLTNRGLFLPGIRVACDSMVNLSPAMIEEFMSPFFIRMAEEFTRVLVHYCTTPAPSGHVIGVLKKCPGVFGVDNWQGYRTLFKAEDEEMLQDQLTVLTDIPADKLWEELETPFFKDVKRKGGRGLIVSTTANTVDEGKCLYDQWQAYFGM